MKRSFSRCRMDSQNTDFEAWARMLIARKVPEDSAQFINSEVVRSGAAILMRGEGFEVHLLQSEDSVSSSADASGVCVSRIIVTPLPQLYYRSVRPAAF